MKQTEIREIAALSREEGKTQIEERIFNIRGKQVMIDKDLGKNWFGFTLMENTDAEEFIGKV